MKIEIVRQNNTYSIVVGGVVAYTTTNKEDAKAYRNMVFDYYSDKEKRKNATKMCQK